MKKILFVIVSLLMSVLVSADGVKSDGISTWFNEGGRTSNISHAFDDSTDIDQDKPVSTGTSGDYPYNGMGKVVLKKNIVNGVNLLTQGMMPLASGKNTIYVVQYDFVLGEDVTIPDNSVLEFDGGSITAGNGAKKSTISGQNTAIQAGLTKIFDTNLQFSGTWKVEYAYPEWFGAMGNGTNNDTDAFYAALSSFNSIFLSGGYCIDFRDIDLENKTIVGKWRTRSGIVQRNSNVPFALVKTYNFLDRFTFFVRNNTKITDVLHFGYSGGKYNPFTYTDITNIVFVGKNDDDKTIPLHFNMKNGGNTSCIVDNVRMYHCYIGVWYEFNKNSDPFGWVTQCSMKDVTIYNPSYYGFKWDALSMYNNSPMWCYNNYFENIGISIVRDGATGFYIGHGMGMLVNPMVFNDIPASQSKAVGYSVEFAPIGSPIRSKMMTNIIGGSFEGQVKNMEYANMNNIENLKISLRDNRGSTDRYITLDSNSIPEACDLNVFGKDVLNTFTIKNASLSVGSDEFGEYLKVTRIDPKAEAVFSGGITKQDLMDYGAKNGLFTLQTVAQSNLGESGTGFYFQSPEYRYTIDGQSSESMIMGEDGKRIGNNLFIKVTDNLTKRLEFGYYFGANTGHKWVKIYSIRLLPGIISKYFMEKPKMPKKDIINIVRTFNIGSGSLKCTAIFNTINEVTNNSSPISVQCEGELPPGEEGEIVTVGKLQCYHVPGKKLFQVYNSESGNVVGMCFVETDGTFKIKYLAKIDKLISVYGSA